LLGPRRLSDRPFVIFGHRNIKPTEGNGNETIEPNEIAKLGRTVRPEGINCCSIGQLRQHTAANEGSGDIVSNSLFAGEIGWTLPRDEGGELRIRKLVVLRDHNMGVEFITGPEMRAGNENSNLAGGIRQLRLLGQRFSEIPNGLAEARLVEPMDSTDPSRRHPLG
jgi:hypothetical protein